MSTSTKTPRRARAESTIELDVAELGAVGLEAGERFAGGERSELPGRAQRLAGETLRAAAGVLPRSAGPAVASFQRSWSMMSSIGRE
jgi:hypothetical protein